MAAQPLLLAGRRLPQLAAGNRPQSPAGPCLRRSFQPGPAARRSVSSPPETAAQTRLVCVVAENQSPWWSRSRWWGVGWVGFRRVGGARAEEVREMRKHFLLFN